MSQDPIDGLVKIGFSEYEAKAYVALLRENPITGYQLAKLSGVPRSMIYEVLSKLVLRGAAMILRKEGSTQGTQGTRTLYAPVPAGQFVSAWGRLQTDLAHFLFHSLIPLLKGRFYEVQPTHSFSGFAGFEGAEPG